MKKNLRSHCSYKHAKLDKLHGQTCLDKVNALLWGLDVQQGAFARPQSGRDSVIQASFVASELRAKRLKSHSEGEFVLYTIVPKCIFCSVFTVTSEYADEETKVKLQGNNLLLKDLLKTLAYSAQD